MEINMKIEFTVEDYFNELQSMEKYYGQEEELYPWIYMLLQMVEIREKNILKEDYDKLCIIDVHNAQHAESDYDLKKLMQGHNPSLHVEHYAQHAEILLLLIQILILFVVVSKSKK